MSMYLDYYTWCRKSCLIPVSAPVFNNMRKRERIGIKNQDKFLSEEEALLQQYKIDIVLLGTDQQG